MKVKAVFVGGIALALGVVVTGGALAEGKHAGTVERTSDGKKLGTVVQERVSADGKGNCVGTIRPPETKAKCHLNRNDPPARLRAIDWYCTSKPAEAMREIDKLLRSLMAGGKDAGVASRERALKLLEKRAEVYLHNRGTQPRLFWQAKVPGPWTLNPRPGATETHQVGYCFTDRELKIMKWEAISWAEDVQRYLKSLGWK